METLDRIQALLKEHHRTQKDLTDYLGIGKSVFTSWRNGVNTSYIKYAAQIAKFFDVSVDYLLGNTDQKNPPASKSQNPDDALLFALYGGEDTDDITPEMLEDVRNFAQFIRKTKGRGNG